MLMIRLQRVGRRNDPSFRVVVTEKTKGPQSGGFLEIVGSYDPRKDRLHLKNDRIKHWLSHGAKTSGTVNNLFVKENIITGPKVDVRSRKKLTPKEPFDASQGKETKEELVSEEKKES
ncbi:MAG: 30S ribosomal protein S16 [Candidatus Niyogibacteria bacterium]|nr:30S ribosomal protein S16 [Candidatus Niyogibacteria bacterium]